MFNMGNVDRIIISLFSIALLAASVSISEDARASDAGAFIGGMVTTRVLSNMSRRTRAEEVQAYNSSRAAQQPQAAPKVNSESIEDKLAQLDKLAAGGYITKEEYSAKRKSIIDSM